MRRGRGSATAIAASAIVPQRSRMTMQDRPARSRGSWVLGTRERPAARLTRFSRGRSAVRTRTESWSKIVSAQMRSLHRCVEFRIIRDAREVTRPARRRFAGVRGPMTGPARRPRSSHARAPVRFRARMRRLPFALMRAFRFLRLSRRRTSVVAHTHGRARHGVRGRTPVAWVRAPGSSRA